VIALYRHWRGAELTRPAGMGQRWESQVSLFSTRATAGYCLSPLFGLLSASRGFTALHACSL